jgi:hypothetical protein
MLFSNEMVPPVPIARSIRDEASFMQSPCLCLEIAQHISDSQEVENLRASAATHFASAHKVERRTEIADSDTP